MVEAERAITSASRCVTVRQTSTPSFWLRDQAAGRRAVPAEVAAPRARRRSACSRAGRRSRRRCGRPGPGIQDRVNGFLVVATALVDALHLVHVGDGIAVRRSDGIGRLRRDLWRTGDGVACGRTIVGIRIGRKSQFVGKRLDQLKPRTRAAPRRSAWRSTLPRRSRCIVRSANRCGAPSSSGD